MELLLTPSPAVAAARKGQRVALQTDASSRRNAAVRMQNVARSCAGAASVLLACSMVYKDLPALAAAQVGSVEQQQDPAASAREQIRRIKVSAQARRAKAMDDKLKGVLKKLEAEPDSLIGHKALLQVYMERGELTKAIAVLDKLILLQPDHYELLYTRARAYDMAGEVKMARSEFEKLAKAQPFSAKVLQGLVFCMLKDEESEAKVVDVIQAAISNAREHNMRPAARNFKMLMGQVLTAQKKLDEALAQYEELIQEDPDDFRPYVCQGLLYDTMGKREEATKVYEIYSKLCPSSFPRRKFLDDVLIRGRNSQAGEAITMQQPLPPK